MGRFRDQWEQVRGNFKYEAAKSVVIWFFTKFGVSVIATLTAFITFLLVHREVPLLIGIPAAFWMLQILLASVVPKRLRLKFVTHGDNSLNVYLEVFNESPVIDLSAQLRILSRSDGRSVKQFGYKGIWTGPDFSISSRVHVPEQGSKISVRVDTGKSDCLLIATMQRQQLHGQSVLDLIGIDEKLMWDFEVKDKNAPLPYLTLQIDVFGQGIDKPVKKIYRLGPKHSRGPIGMSEVTT